MFGNCNHYLLSNLNTKEDIINTLNNYKLKKQLEERLNIELKTNNINNKRNKIWIIDHTV